MCGVERIASSIIAAAAGLFGSVPAPAVELEVSASVSTLQVTPDAFGRLEWVFPEIPIDPVTIPAGVNQDHVIHVSFADPALVKLGQSELLVRDLVPGGGPDISFFAELRTQDGGPLAAGVGAVPRVFGTRYPDYNGQFDSTGGMGNQSGEDLHLLFGGSLFNFFDRVELQLSQLELTTRVTLPQARTFDRILLRGVAGFVDSIPRICEGTGDTLHICPVSASCLNSKLCHARSPRARVIIIRRQGATAANFRSLQIPTPLSGVQSLYEVDVEGTVVPLATGEELLFESLAPGGVSEFRILGADTAEIHDPDDPEGFVSAVSFVDGSTDPFDVVRSIHESVPALGAAGTVALGGALLLAGRRRLGARRGHGHR